MKYNENIEMHVSPENVLLGYVVTQPIYVGINFEHDQFNQVSGVQVACKVELLHVINWQRLNHEIGSVIADAMVQIAHNKKAGLYV